MALKPFQKGEGWFGEIKKKKKLLVIDELQIFTSDIQNYVYAPYTHVNVLHSPVLFKESEPF